MGDNTRLGSARGSGTDANVSMTVYGENGNSGVIKLDSVTNPFETGATDVSRNFNSWNSKILEFWI